MLPTSPSANAEPEPRSKPGTLAWALFLTILAILGIVLGVFGALLVTAYRVIEVSGRNLAPEWGWAIGQAIGLGLVAGMAALIAGLWRAQPFRSYLIGLAGLAGLAATLSLVRATEIQADGWRSTLTLLIGALWLGLGWLATRGRRLRLGRAGGLLTGLACALLMGTPWLVFGALGALSALAGQILASLVLGAASAIWLEGFVFGPTAAIVVSWRRSLLAAGFVAAIGLLLMGLSVGANAMQLIVAPPIAALGWLVAWQDRTARDKGSSGRVAVTLVLGITVALALSTFDPEEQSMYLIDDAVGLWATAASLSGVVLALALGLVGLALGTHRSGATQRGWSGAVTAVVSAGLCLGLYLGVGQPGAYGDRLFVVLRDQADLTAIDPGLDQKTRAAAVYSTLTAHAITSQADLRATFDAFRISYTPYYLVNAIEVDGGPLVRIWLSLRPEVASITTSQVLRPVFVEPAPTSGSESPPLGPQWNLTLIGVDRVWAEFGATGSGIVVGQSDSGVEGEHPALAAQYRGREEGDDYNWLDPWEKTSSPSDRGGHGTHTLGTILGAGGIGVAPEATWLACRNLARNLGSPALYLDCMQFMLAPYPRNGSAFVDGDPNRGAHVINNSWGCPSIEGCSPATLGPAVDALRAAGIFVVASAGNDGPGCSTVMDPIAIYDGAFSVGAIDSLGELAGFSSRGPVPGDGAIGKPDIAAPGVDVLSALPNGTYGSNSGTSMAGPHIVGVVALMWSANPRLIGDIDTTEQLLRDTARPYTGALTAPNCDLAAHPEWAVGAGIVDAYAAVQAALALP